MAKKPASGFFHSVSLGEHDEDWQHLSCACGQKWKIVTRPAYPGTDLMCPARNAA